MAEAGQDVERPTVQCAAQLSSTIEISAEDGAEINVHPDGSVHVIVGTSQGSARQEIHLTGSGCSLTLRVRPVSMRTAGQGVGGALRLGKQPKKRQRQQNEQPQLLEQQQKRMQQQQQQPRLSLEKAIGGLFGGSHGAAPVQAAASGAAAAASGVAAATSGAAVAAGFGALAAEANTRGLLWGGTGCLPLSGGTPSAKTGTINDAARKSFPTSAPAASASVETSRLKWWMNSPEAEAAGGLNSTKAGKEPAAVGQPGTARGSFGTGAPSASLSSWGLPCGGAPAVAGAATGFGFSSSLASPLAPACASSPGRVPTLCPQPNFTFGAFGKSFAAAPSPEPSSHAACEAAAGLVPARTSASAEGAAGQSAGGATGAGATVGTTVVKEELNQAGVAGEESTGRPLAEVKQEQQLPFLLPTQRKQAALDGGAFFWEGLPPVASDAVHAVQEPSFRLPQQQEGGDDEKSTVNAGGVVD